MDKNVSADAAVLTCGHSCRDNAKQPIHILFDLVADCPVFVQERAIGAGSRAADFLKVHMLFPDLPDIRCP